MINGRPVCQHSLVDVKDRMVSFMNLWRIVKKVDVDVEVGRGLTDGPFGRR